MLIRPTLLKDFRHRVWKEAWQWAGRKLAECRQWVFVGYSLPLADVWMLRLLTQSVRSKGIKNRSISIVDPNDKVIERYKLLFPQAERVESTFSEYIEKSHSAGRPI